MVKNPGGFLARTIRRGRGSHGSGRRMASGLTSPAGDELARLRRQYDRLCDLVTRTAESDPAAAERVLSELQTLSTRILELENAEAKGASPDDAGRTPLEQLADPAPSPAPHAPTPVADQQARDTPPPGRIVSLRVTPSVLQQPAQPPAAQPSSWRLDPPAPPASGAPDPARPAPLAESLPVRAEAKAPGAGLPPAQPPRPHPEAKSEPAEAPEATARPVQQEPAPTPAPSTSRPPAQPASPPPRPTIVVRRPAAGAAKPAAPSMPASSPTPAAAVQPTATPPGTPSDAPAGAPSDSSAKVFSSAIRDWLERHRATLSESKAAPAAEPEKPAEDTAPSQSQERAAPTKDSKGDAAAESASFARVAAAVERQAMRIERLLELSEAHQAALERLEKRIVARLERTSREPDPELPELRQAVQEQRQRLTELARTIQNLAQWLAAQRN